MREAGQGTPGAQANAARYLRHPWPVPGVRLTAEGTGSAGLMRGPVPSPGILSAQRFHMNTDIPGYVYLGDMGSVAAHGGAWFGVAADTLGYVIAVIGAADLESGHAEVAAFPLFVRGHVEMREALRSAGWRRDHTLGPADRDIRRAFLLQAYLQHWGPGTTPDYTEEVDPDTALADDVVIAFANRYAR